MCTIVADTDCASTGDDLLREISGAPPAQLANEIVFKRIQSDAPQSCPQCSEGKLRSLRAIEVGHTFLLGSRYSEVLGYSVPSADGKQRVPLQMGCYGIGITRILGTLAQQSLARFTAARSAGAGSPRFAGFAWPHSVAPYEALVLPAPPHTSAKMAAAERLCAALAEGVAPSWTDAAAEPASFKIPQDEVALDDRPGMSFGARLFDADLVGYPTVFIIGKHWEKTGQVEVRRAGQPSRYATFAGIETSLVSQAPAP